MSTSKECVWPTVRIFKRGKLIIPVMNSSNVTSSEVTLNPNNIQNEDRKLLEATMHSGSQAFLPHLAVLRAADIGNMYQSSFSVGSIHQGIDYIILHFFFLGHPLDS